MFYRKGLFTAQGALQGHYRLSVIWHPHPFQRASCAFNKFQFPVSVQIGSAVAVLELKVVTIMDDLGFEDDSVSLSLAR